MGHEEALLQETEESVRLRNASGPGEASDTAKDGKKDEGVKNRE